MQHSDDLGGGERLLAEIGDQALVLRLDEVSLLGILARQELADLAADRTHSIQQPFIGLADVQAVKGEHADGAARRGDRKIEHAAHARLAGRIAAAHVRHHVDVGHP